MSEMLRDPFGPLERSHQAKEFGVSALSLATAQSLKGFFERNWPNAPLPGPLNPSGWPIRSLMDQVNESIARAEAYANPPTIVLPRGEELRLRLEKADVLPSVRSEVAEAVEQEFADIEPTAKQLFLSVAGVIRRGISSEHPDPIPATAHATWDTIWEMSGSDPAVDAYIDVLADQYEAGTLQPDDSTV